MVDKVLLGHGAIGNDHPIGPANQYVAKDLPQTEYDADKAKFYLKKAGLTSLNVDLSAADAAFGGALDAAQLYQNSSKASDYLESCKRFSETNKKNPVGPSDESIKYIFLSDYRLLLF